MAIVHRPIERSLEINGFFAGVTQSKFCFFLYSLQSLFLSLPALVKEENWLYNSRMEKLLRFTECIKIFITSNLSKKKYVQEGTMQFNHGVELAV